MNMATILCEKNHIKVSFRKNKRKFAVDFPNCFLQKACRR